MTRHHGRRLARRRPVPASLLCGLAVVVAACGGDSTGPSNPPSINLATSALTFAVAQGGANPAPQTVAVTPGVDQRALVNLKVGTITYIGAGGWLSATLDKSVAPATAPATLTLDVTSGGLSVGSYTATVPVTSITATNSPKSLSVTLLVLGGTSPTNLAAAGQSAVFLDNPNFGTELTTAAGAQYLIAVVNTAQSPAAKEDFTLAGARLTGPSANVASLRQAAPSASAARVLNRYPLRSRGPDPAWMQQLVRNHLTVLDRGRRVFASMGNPAAVRARLEATGRRFAPLAAAIATTVGTVNKVYVSNSASGDCTAVDSIGARTVAVGQHIIVAADTNLTAWPQDQRPDSSFYQTFADEYDQVTWPHLQTYIGDPLAYDANLSGVGKVTLTITPVLNNLGGGVIAFVNPCDFFPFVASGPQADFSNNTEMFYSLTPATNGFSVINWEKELRATSAHESKHIVAVADRIINNSSTLEDVWLEEGLAQVSSEIWMRHFNQATWKGHAGFSQTVDCEFQLGFSSPPCDALGGNPLDLSIGHFQFLFRYLLDESRLNNEGFGTDVDSDYGAGWAFARWATDQYASDEGMFIKSLVNEPVLTGLPNVSSHAGQAIPLLLTYWNLASAIYGFPQYTAADVRITIPSFNFPDIFSDGQTLLTCGGVPCGFFTQSGTPVFPVQPIAVSEANINHVVRGVPGTAAAFFLLTTTTGGTEALQVESGSGGPVSSSSALRVGIIRVQ